MVQAKPWGSSRKCTSPATSIYRLIINLVLKELTTTYNYAANLAIATQDREFSKVEATLTNTVLALHNTSLIIVYVPTQPRPKHVHSISEIRNQNSP
jgi:hypothetical protein